jgi:LysR family nod box-dependent transcriptional activator
VRLRQVDLNLLVTLDALLRERNVTRAGREVGLSQPAMSTALGRLRQLFDDPLLVRVGREYRLTPLASDLMAPLQAALASLEQTLGGNGAFDPSAAQREFRIAAADYTIAVLLQPLVARLAKIAPGVRVHLRTAGTNVAKQLAAGHIDLSVQPVGSLADFPSQSLFSESWICAVWKGNTEVGEELTREQWSRLSHASFGLGRSGAFLADLQLGPLAVERTRAVIAESFLAVPLLLRNTNMVALLPRRLAELLRASAEIRLMAPPVQLPDFVEAMTWSPLFNADAGHQWLRRELSDVAKQL